MGDAALWASLAFAALAVGAGGFALGRRLPAREKNVENVAAKVLAVLAARSAPLDLLPGPLSGGAPGCGPSAEQAAASGEPLARCVATALTPEGLVCELIDSAAAEVRPGRGVTCFFAPLRLAGRKVNAFESEIVSVDSAAEPPRLVLRAPQEIVSIPRRRHARKRVSDPRFVRVRLWLADAAKSSLHFPEAAPDLWINAYDGRHGDENAVTDISPGGLAMEVRAGLVPQGLALGSPVVVKCSLFQFKEKQFKAYWYAGLVRGVSSPDNSGGTMRRIAIGFTAVGAPDGAGPQGIVWQERTENAIAGGRT